LDHTKDKMFAQSVNRE